MNFVKKKIKRILGNLRRILERSEQYRIILGLINLYFTTIVSRLKSSSIWKTAWRSDIDFFPLPLSPETWIGIPPLSGMSVDFFGNSSRAKKQEEEEKVGFFLSCCSKKRKRV